MVDTDELGVLTPKRIGRLNISPVAEVPVTFNLMVYGDPGVGKTVLCGSASLVADMNPVLFVDMEGGTLSIRELYPNVDVVRVKNMIEMQEVYDALRKGETEYKTVVIDSLTELQKFSMGQVMLKVVEEDPDRDPDIPSLREWGKNLEQTRRFVRAFRDLPLNTLFTALANIDKDQKTGKILTRPGLTGKAANEVSGFLDIVLYMYLKEVDEEQHRLLLTQKTDRVIAKDRSGKLPGILQNVDMAEIYRLAFIANQGQEEEETDGSS
jgi:phage nucleotide-binding protein